MEIAGVGILAFATAGLTGGDFLFWPGLALLWGSDKARWKMLFQPMNGKQVLSSVFIPIAMLLYVMIHTLKTPFPVIAVVMAIVVFFTIVAVREANADTAKAMKQNSQN